MLPLEQFGIYFESMDQREEDHRHRKDRDHFHTHGVAYWSTITNGLKRL